MEQLYIGVDVSKEKCDVYVNSEYFTIENNEKGMRKLFTKVSKLKSPLKPFVICEATGGYEQGLVNFLREKSIDCHIVHPNKVRAFAKAKGIRAKTDKIDAKIIHDFALTFNPEADTINLSENERYLQELVKRREQLIREKIQESNRLDKLMDRRIKKSIEDHIKWIEKEIEKIEGMIKSLEKEDKAIAEKVNLLTSVACIGKIVAYNLITYLPELGKITHKEVASLVGVAPMNRESGKYKGKSFVQGGRGQIRKYLYMSAITSVRNYEEMGAFYKKLKSRGKQGKVILTAIMRRFLMVLNSVSKRQTPWVKAEVKNVVFA